MKPYLDKVMELVRKGGKVPIIVSGEARGADKHGEFYARTHRIEIDPHPADWDNLGNSAGYIRNEEMAIVGDLVLVFWDGKSPGSKSMIELGEKHKKITKVIKYNEGSSL